ncbi:MAG: hypothetical protein ACE364_05300 [Chlorobiota bacterium]|jgi:hypothetical protein
MAKKQTFDSKGKGSDLTSVKVLKWYQDENRGTLRLLTKLIKVKDLNELQKIEINK